MDRRRDARAGRRRSREDLAGLETTYRDLGGDYFDRLDNQRARLGRELGVPTPVHAMLYAWLRPRELAVREAG